MLVCSFQLWNQLTKSTKRPFILFVLKSINDWCYSFQLLTQLSKTHKMTIHNRKTSNTCFSLYVSSPLSMIFSTIGMLLLASSSLAAVIQICRSVGMFSRALFKTYQRYKTLLLNKKTKSVMKFLRVCITFLVLSPFLL